MSFRTWVYVFAIIGLILPALGQAQEAQSDKGRAGNNEEPSSSTSAPLPVIIVESQAESDAKKAAEKHARDREIADLAAQEGMNASTKEIKDATNDMRDYAKYSTIAVWVGTGLLLYTLWLTREANRAAQDSVSVTRNLMTDQIRAYVAVGLQKGNQNGTDILIQKEQVIFRFRFHNQGQTPARNLRFSGTVWLRKFGEVCAWGEVTDMHGSVAPDDGAFIDGAVKIKSKSWLKDQGDLKLFLKGTLRYETFHGVSAETSTSLFGMINAGNPSVHFEYCENGNHIT